MFQIVWDPVKKAWVDTTKDGEEETAPLAPPPSMTAMAPLPVGLTPTEGGGGVGGGNRFGLKGIHSFVLCFLPPSLDDHHRPQSVNIERL